MEAASSSTWWLQAIWDVVGGKLADHLPDQLAYGSDCSGVDAPMWALSALLSDIKERYEIRMIFPQEICFDQSQVKLD